MMRTAAIRYTALWLLLSAGCSNSMDQADTSFDAEVINAWVGMWNSYDLDLVDRLFLTDSLVTYISSEREGVIAGIDSLREHHRGFGFVSGGKETATELWLEDLHVSEHARATVVSGTWYFRRDPNADEIQRGPVTLVYMRVGDQHRIAHAHFSNY
jgi:hypothetical protein